MHNFGVLLRGEMQRLVRYKILQISFVVSLLWLGILFLIGSDHVADFVPLFIFIDVSMMTVLLVGANLFFEKQENTLKTLLITPSDFVALLASKFVSSLYLGLQSTVVIALFAVLMFDVSIAVLWLIVFVLLITCVHTAIGFTFVVFVKDFNGLLAFTIFYMFLFAFPSIFFMLDLLPSSAEYWLMFSPTHAGMLMINYTFGEDVAWWLLLLGALYLVVLSAVLIRFVISPKYVETAVRE